MKTATTKPQSTERNFMRTAAVLVASAMLLAIAPAVRGGSIFDDNYTPPRRAESAPQPATLPTVPHEAPPATLPAGTPSTTSPSAVAPSQIPATNPAASPSGHGAGAIPDLASRAKCRKLFEEVYATELKDRSPAARRKLAESLFTEAGKTAEGSPDRFVLLNGAFQAAGEGQNLRMGFAAARQLAAEYGIDELAAQADVATRTFAGSPPPALASVGNIERLLDLSDRLTAEDDFATAAEVESALQRVLSSIPDVDLRTEVKDQIREVAAMHDAREKVGPALAQLRKMPDDPAANLAVGTYRCFQRGQWDGGLPLLAKSNDAQLKDIAVAELAHPTDGDALIKLADRWFDVAAKLAAPDRLKVLQHASGLYRSADANLTGLQKLAIEKRIAGIPQPNRLRRIDLLDMFDPATSIVKGAWKMQDGTLVSDASDGGRVDFAYEPPDEYDFRISFTPLTDVRGIDQICYGGGHQFAFMFLSNLAAFENIKGVDGRNNKTGKRKDQFLVKGKRYISLVKVRKSGVEGFVNGELITSLKTDYADMSIVDFWRLSRGNVVGIGVYQNSLRLDAAEIIEITGEGKLLSP